jgi:hypothetical protein
MTVSGSLPSDITHDRVGNGCLWDVLPAGVLTLCVHASLAAMMRAAQLDSVCICLYSYSSRSFCRQAAGMPVSSQHTPCDCQCCQQTTGHAHTAAKGCSRTAPNRHDSTAQHSFHLTFSSLLMMGARRSSALLKSDSGLLWPAAPPAAADGLAVWAGGSAEPSTASGWAGGSAGPSTIWAGGSAEPSAA